MNVYNMTTENVTVREFIKKYLIDKIEDVKNSHPYFAFLLMAVGIEFLGKCQNEHDWDDHDKIGPRTNFEKGLKIGALKKYANITDLYDNLRNGLAHSFLIKKGIKVSDGDSVGAINSHILYDDFKNACYEVLNAISGVDGILRTSKGIEIKKDLDATFFTTTNGINQQSEPFSITANTQNIQTIVVK